MVRTKGRLCNYIKILVYPILFKVLLEQLAWTLALALVAILLYQEISSYFAFITDHPVVTSVSLRPAGEVAFPAVVVDAGDAVDPLSLELGFKVNDDT